MCVCVSITLRRRGNAYDFRTLITYCDELFFYEFACTNVQRDLHGTHDVGTECQSIYHIRTHSRKIEKRRVVPRVQFSTSHRASFCKSRKTVYFFFFLHAREIREFPLRTTRRAVVIYLAIGEGFCLLRIARGTETRGSSKRPNILILFRYDDRRRPFLLLE